MSSGISNGAAAPSILTVGRYLDRNHLQTRAIYSCRRGRDPARLNYGKEVFENVQAWDFNICIVWVYMKPARRKLTCLEYVEKEEDAALVLMQV